MVRMQSTRLFVVYTLFAFFVAACGSGGGGGGSPAPSQPDTTPNSFSFPALDDVDVNAGEQTSSEITISGIDAETAISIVNGLYSKNGGEFTSANGTVQNGDRIRIRVTAPTMLGETTTATVTVGGVVANFEVSTSALDTEPGAFSFAAVTNAALNTVFESPSVTITGINTGAAISITNGQYSINDGTPTSAAGTIQNGDTVKVIVTSSDMFSTQTLTTVTVGGVEASFSVTTLAQDIEPDSFSFMATANVGLGALVASDTVTIQGLNDAAPISIVGGSYSIDGGDFASDAGTISSGQTLQLRATSSANFSTPVTATVTVGGFEASFTATTLAADEAPSDFSFAPVTGAEISTQVTSASATIEGINTAVAVSVSGGEYSIDDGAFTADAGVINSGSTVKVRLTSSANYAEETSATLTVGSANQNFSVTTRAEDTVPDAFNFAAVNEAARGAVVESATITVTGVDNSSAISIVGGEYSIGGEAFTADAGTVNLNDTVKVRLTASSDFSSAIMTTLTIGGTEATFTVTTLAQDTTPDNFAFTAQNDVARSTAISSTAVAINGINDASPISVSGGEYAINGGAFTSADGQITNGQTVTLRVSSSSDFSTAATVTATIGGVASDFVVTTLARDVDPDPFAFNAQMDVAKNTVIASNAVTIAAINDAADISIAGGEYSIDGGAYTAVAGTVTLGQMVTVRLTSADAFSTLAETTLTIGNQMAKFSVTTLAQDITPDTYSFMAVSGVAINTLTTSDTVTINGINDAADVVAAADTEYSIDGGTFTSAAGQISNGQTLQVRRTSSSSFETAVDATVTVGDGSAVAFTVTTEAEDLVPEPFMFTDAVDVALSTQTTSDAITVSGINSNASVTVTGGEYSIDNGAFTSVMGTVSNGQQIRVRGTSSASVDTTVNVELTVGGVADSFAITTPVDEDAPTVTILFPPPSSMTDLGTVTIRGTASDTLSEITSVQVNGMDVEDTSAMGQPAFSTWKLDAGLSSGSNTLTVSAADAELNANTSAGSVEIIANPTLPDFPDSTNPVPYAADIILDTTSNPPIRAFIADWDTNQILTMDLATGARSLFSDNTGQGADTTLTQPLGMVLDETNNRLIVLGQVENSVVEIDLTTKARTLISNNTVPDSNNIFDDINDAIFHPDDSNLLLVADDTHGIIQVNLTTGVRTTFSTADMTRGPVPDTVNPFAGAREIVYDSLNDRLIVTDGLSGNVYGVNIDTGARTIITNNDIDDPASAFSSEISGTAYDPDNNRLLYVFADCDSSVLEMDLTTGFKTSIASAIIIYSLEYGMALATNGAYVYVTDRVSSAIVAVDVETGGFVYVSVGAPASMDIAPMDMLMH